MPNEDWLGVWQSQPAENITVQLEEIRRKARHFESRIRSRNRREYAAAVFVVAAFTFYIVRFPNALIRAGSGLIILGTLYAMYQLHRRSGPPVPANLGLTASLEFHRQELVRQRELLESVWSWYLAPLVPGLLVFTSGAVPKGGLRIALVLALYIIVFGGVWWANRRGAERLSRQIAELDRFGEQL